MSSRLLRLAPVAAGLLGLAGCAVPEPPAAPGAPAEPPTGVGISQPPEREPTRSAELMYQVLAAEMAGHAGQLDTAVEHYLEAARMSDDSRVAQRATRVAVFARDDAAALEAAERWHALAPDDAEAAQALAALHIRAGRIEAAVPYLDRLLAEVKGRAEAGEGFMVITSLLSREGDKAGALEAMRLLVDKHRDDPYAHYAHAALAVHAGAPEQARAAIERALSLKPDWPKARVLHARVLDELGRTDAALEALAGVVDAHPADTDLRLTYARMLIGANRLEEAQAQFEVLAEQAPRDPDIMYALGLLAFEAKRYDAAARYFRRLVESGQRVAEGLFYLGNVAQARQDYTEAIHWYAKVPPGEHRLDAQMRIALLKAKRGDVEAGREKLAGLRRAHPSDEVRLYVAEVELLREVKRYRAGLELSTRALEAHPGNRDLLYARALLAEKLGRIDMVERDLHEILEQNPDDPHALNALGYTLADRTERHREALGYIRKAYERRPDDPAVIDSMGWVHYRLGHYAKAVKYLRRALELSGDPEIAAHLGEVLWVRGEHRAAMEVWRRALKETPDSEVLRDVMNRFRR